MKQTIALCSVALALLFCSSSQELELGGQKEWRQNNELIGKIVRTGENSYDFIEDKDGDGIAEKIFRVENDQLQEIRYFNPNGSLKQKINYFQGAPASSTVFHEDGSVKGIAYFDSNNQVSVVELPQIRKKVEFR